MIAANKHNRRSSLMEFHKADMLKAVQLEANIAEERGYEDDDDEDVDDEEDGNDGDEDEDISQVDLQITVTNDKARSTQQDLYNLKKRQSVKNDEIVAMLHL
eukprot:168241_1